VDIEAVLDRSWKRALACGSTPKANCASTRVPGGTEGSRPRAQAGVDGRAESAGRDEPSSMRASAAVGPPRRRLSARRDLDEIRWAMKVLRMGPMPLVINDEGLEWISLRVASPASGQDLRGAAAGRLKQATEGVEQQTLRRRRA